MLNSDLSFVPPLTKKKKNGNKTKTYDFSLVIWKSNTSTQVHRGIKDIKLYKRESIQAACAVCQYIF